jgi:mono/diheme cytochrome c family protein
MRTPGSISAAALVLGLALGGCRGGESESPPVHLIHNMDTQEKGRPYRKDTSGLFADGRTMREPVEGTVAWGQLNDDDTLHEGLDADAGTPTMAYPKQRTTGEAFESNAATKERGHQRYDIYCAPCHGVLGDGQGPLNQPALDGGPRLTVAPPSFHDQRLKDMPVGKLYAAIRNGVNNNNMPSYATQIPTDDRWAIVTYVRKLQMDKDAAVQEEGGAVVVVKKTDKADAEVGAQLYKARGCDACHSLDGTRKVGPTFKGVYGKKEQTSAGEVVVDDAYIKESLEAPNAKVVNDYPPAMPPQTVTDVELGSLILFIKAQK